MTTTCFTQAGTTPAIVWVIQACRHRPSYHLPLFPGPVEVFLIRLTFEIGESLDWRDRALTFESNAPFFLLPHLGHASSRIEFPSFNGLHPCPVLNIAAPKLYDRALLPTNARPEISYGLTTLMSK